MATDGCKEPKLECRFGRQLGAARVASNRAVQHSADVLGEKRDVLSSARLVELAEERRDAEGERRAVEHLVAAAAAAADPPLFSRVVSVSDGFDESADDADGIIISDTTHETRPLWEALSGL